MYIRITPVNGKHYAQVVRSYRDGQKVRQEILFNFGVLENLPTSTLESFVRVISDKILKKRLTKAFSESFTKDQMAGGDILCYGYLPYKHLWKKLQIEEILGNISSKKRQKLGYDLSGCIYSMVINRLLSPSSKLMHHNKKQRFALLEGDTPVQLHQYYRSLEILAENKEEIEGKLFESRKNLFNAKLSVLFYDVTTFHFESQKSSELLNYGFSKANKVNEVQVVMGLLIDTDGIPVGYDLFPGNTFDAKTLPAVISSLKRKYNIDRIILVGDKGINSKENLINIKEAGFDYIVAGRLRSSSAELKKSILDKEGYTETVTGQTAEEDIFRYKVIPHENKVTREGKEYRIEENLICTYSLKRAESDRADRERGIKKAEKAIASGVAGTLIRQKNGYKRFIKQENEHASSSGKLVLDTRRAKNEEAYDGYYFIQTSDRSLSPLEVINQYGFLFKIEESFRILKTTMNTRPVFHWNPERIRGHFMVCFIALLLERALELKLKESSVEYSVEKIKDALNNSVFAGLNINDRQFYLKMKQPELAFKIFNALRIKHPKDILSQQDLTEYIS
ncbi:MAG: IS1634 family transposase [Ignavibacteriaceae bacterium]|nr:IS1634 family transposase [Ignavibacteriaceae bacterium]